MAAIRKIGLNNDFSIYVWHMSIYVIEDAELKYTIKIMKWYH